MKKIKYIIFSLFFTILNSNIAFATSEGMNIDKLIILGEKCVSVLLTAMSYSVLIVGAVKLIHAFILNKYTLNKLFEVARECIAILLFIYIVPKIPMILSVLIPN